MHFLCNYDDFTHPCAHAVFSAVLFTHLKMKFLIVLALLRCTIADHDSASYGGNAKDVMKNRVSQKLSAEMRSVVQRMRNQVVINARALERTIMRENFINLQGQFANIGNTIIGVSYISLYDGDKQIYCRLA